MKLEDLGSERTITWYADCRMIDARTWSELFSLLSQQEQDRAARFHFEHDRKSYIAAHGMVRSMLSLLDHRHPHDIEFSTSDFGKPEYIMQSKLTPRIRVNISHTHHMAIAAIALDSDIGVDIEWLGRHIRCLEIAQSVMTDEERAFIASVEKDQTLTCFLTFWTLKEAYIKATGKGLSLPLNQFHFSLEPLAINFKSSHEKSVMDDPNNWHLRYERLGEDHVVAIAVHNNSLEQMTLDIEPAPFSLIKAHFF
jgi:4'-phosphopantetheinyl transferase